MLTTGNYMTKLLMTLPLGIVINLGLLYLIRKISTSYQIFPKADFRRKKNEIPLLGGVAIYVTFCILSFVLESKESIYLAAAALPIILSGILDDIFELSAKLKFGLQNLSFVLFFILFHKHPLFLNAFDLSSPTFYFVSMCWFIGVTNSFNLLDGTDGQCSLIATAVAIGLTVLSGSYDSTTLVLIFATLGFVIFNLPPAKIYLGDSGSNFLGFILAAKAMLVVPPVAGDYTYALAMLFLFSLPLTDTVNAMIRRRKNNRSIAEGDKDHIHHKLMKIGLNKKQTIFITTFIAFFGVMTGVLVFKSTNTAIQLLMMFTTGSLLTFIYVGILYVENHLGRRTSIIGNTLIKKHLNIGDEEHPVLPFKKAVLFDLLPYYSELKLEGLPVIDAFIQEITQLSLKYQPPENIHTVGSYSILITLSTNDTWLPHEKMEISSDLFKIFNKFKITKNSSKIPEGIYFYDHNSMGKLMKILELKPRAKRKVA